MKPIRSLIDSKEKLLKLLLAIVMIALLIYMPSTRNRRVLNIAIVVFMYIALGESWNVLSGLTGIFSIAPRFPDAHLRILTLKAQGLAYR